MAQNIHLQPVLNQPSEAAMKLPFHPLLPKGRCNLLRWRLYVRQRCIQDLEFRNAIWQMCAQDVAFFAATFAVFHETRIVSEVLGKFPVILDTDQVDILAWLAKYVGRTDVTIEKTRGVGLSYLICIVFLWIWLFRGEQLELAMVSKDKDSLDALCRPSTLMGKLDLLFAELPYWFRHTEDGRPILHRKTTDHSFVHKVNNNAILGFVPTADKLRSGRFFTVCPDEAAFLDMEDQRWLASSQGTTLSRIWISTHDGTANMFYRLTRNEHSQLVRISTFWWTNTRCARGMYKSSHGRIEILDQDFKFPIDYDFSHDTPDLLRSPWVDMQFARPGADLLRLKQELYGVAVLDLKRIIQPRVTAAARASCIRPFAVGELSKDGEFTEDLEGRWKFWKDPLQPFDGGPYYIGMDPALSKVSGAFAALCVINSKTGEVVATASLEDADPIEFARLGVALAKLIAGSRGAGYAILCPEVTGVGISCLTELQRLRWPAIFSESQTRVGLHNADSGEKWLLEVARAITDGDVIVRDTRIVDDLEHLEYNDKLDVVFTGTAGHGDLGMAFAIAFWSCRDRRRAIKKAAEKPTTHSLLREPAWVDLTTGNRLWSDQFLKKRR